MVRDPAAGRPAWGHLLSVLLVLLAGTTAGVVAQAPAVATAAPAAAPLDTPTDPPVRFRGLKPAIEATAYLFRSTDGVYDKPVVIPLGFDAKERVRDLTLEEIYALYSPFVDPARARGYDVWIVQTLTGQNIHEQAAEFAQAVNYAADLLGPDRQVIVGAYSLGGLVARIATARWEDPDEAAWRTALGLRPELPVSVVAFGDAPLKGANVNLNLQKAVWYEFHRQSDFNLDSCGAQQLLRFSEGGVHPDLRPGEYVYARNHQKFFEEGKPLRFKGFSPTADDYEVDDQGFYTSLCDQGPAVYRINGDGWAHRPRLVAFSDGMPGPTRCYAGSNDLNRRGETVCPAYRARPYTPQVGDAMYRIHVPLGGDYDAKAEAGDLEGGSRISTVLGPDTLVCVPTGCYGPEQYFTGAFIPVSSAVPAGAPFAATRYNSFQGVHAFGYSAQIEWLLGQLGTGGGGGPCPPTDAPVPQGPAGNTGTARPTFRWTAVDGAETYTLYVQRVSDGSVVLQAAFLGSTSFRPAQPLPTGIALRWKVKGECDAGRKAGPYSPDSHFTATTGGGGPCPPTAAPTVGGPSGTITSPRPTFSWSAVPGAETYTLYVQRVSDGSVVLQRVLIPGLSVTPDAPLPTGIDLRWKVKGECDEGRKAGPYSASPQFRIQTGAPPPAVTITAPANGSNVAGPTTVSANASATVTRTEFYVDGVLQGTDTQAPFAFMWDPTANPLPAPNHPIDYGYFLADGRYGDFVAEVNGYTNLYHAWARRGYESNTGASDDEWLPLMQQALARAAAQNRRIYLNFNLQDQTPGRITPVDRVLDIAAPYWNQIVRIELADEPEWDRAQTEAQIQDLQTRVLAHGLPPRPMGVIYTRDQALTTDAVFAANLDFVVIEAYVEPPGSADAQANIDFLVQSVTAAKNRVPATKQIGLVMQAYARNGLWTDVDTLRDLQVPTYLLAQSDPRVVMINMFSYGRPTGTRERPELTTPHRLIGERVLGTAVPRAGNGPRTLAVKAYDAAGNSASHRVNVRVQLSRPGDFAGDHKADPTIFRPSTGQWAVFNPVIGPPLIYQWGLAGDVPVPGDYLGDAVLDLAVWRPANGTWYIQDRTTGQTRTYQWGLPGDIPVPGDFLGDTRTDLAVWRPSTGTWWLLNPTTGEIKIQQWGLPGDVPLAGDYFGDPRAELTIYRAGAWYTLNPTTGETRSQGWGVAGDVPLAGDFLGDGRTDLVVWRPSTGTWFIRDATTGETAAHPWGVPGDVPVTGDYFGDGRTELAVWRPSTGIWYLRDPNNGQVSTPAWGATGDIPVA